MKFKKKPGLIRYLTYRFLPRRKLYFVATLILHTASVLANRPVPAHAFTPVPRFRAIVLYENGGHHLAYTRAAIPWLNQLAKDSNFEIKYLTHAGDINDSLLNQCDLFIQLDYPPYGWPPQAVSAFEHFMEEGRGGWIGFHHASLVGAFDGYPVWQWFSDFMGGILFKNYIPGFADGMVQVEDTLNPVMKGLPSSFLIEKEEWYTYDHSPRSRVHVIASVNESSYRPPSEIKMGDHPVIWTNEQMKAKNVYIFMGHSPDLFKNKFYTALFKNAIFWAAGKSDKG